MKPQSDNERTRRQFLRDATLSGVGITLCGVGQGGIAAAASPPVAAADSSTQLSPTTNPGSSVTLRWLGDSAPLTSSGVSWGVPWPRGATPKDQQFHIETADGRNVPTQNWPLAYWPEGSLKWSGLAIAAGSDLAGPFKLVPGASPAPASPVVVKESPTSIEISTGRLLCVIPRTGSDLIASLSIDGREIGRSGRLIAMREDRSKETEGWLRQEKYASQIKKVTVEQAGPVRAVIKLEGLHAGSDPARQWLPFSVRLYFTAGLNSIRIVHSFVFDGDSQTDFIRGLGMTFTVPFREELQNRHVRFAADGDGIWGEPVLMSPGYREALVKGARAMNADQLLGKRIPNLDALGEKNKAAFESIAAWDGFKLTQFAPDSFALRKRTGSPSSWLQVFNGNRARGCVFLGDVSGGLAVGVKSFWEKYPSALEINGATTPAGELNVWFWSPDAPAMDMRHYDTIGHDGRISYEDHTDGFSTPTGVANTNELMLWALTETPDNAGLAALAKSANEPPLLVCEPDYYHATNTLGVWSLPDRSSPDTAAVEQQLDREFQFFHGEVGRRRWYGFWDFGDVMRTYDNLRHAWLYDIGGHAWNNTELMPNAWLWFAFLRTGRADVFRFAEAMTRNTSEVDVYHMGRFVGLGSRHNVSHWGCGAKEARISESFLKRFYYYLTTDERTGDLMRETLDVDLTVDRIQPLRKEVTRGTTPLIRVGPDWLAFASNWMTEWERTGNTRYRDYILTGMKCIGAMPEAFVTVQAFRYDSQTKQLFDIGKPNNPAGEFLDLFGGDQIANDLITLIPCPEFEKTWNLLCTNWATDPKWNGYTKMRICAYAAIVNHDPRLKDEAWKLMLASLTKDGHERFPATPASVDGPVVPEPVREIPGIDTPGSSQWALNVITTMELARRFADHSTSRG
jgi:hypothetical protein